MVKLLIFGFVSFLAAVLPGHSGVTQLFESDFGPGDGAHEPASYAPSWDPVSHWEWSAGEYPQVIWQYDPSRAPEGGNGYFKEVVRESGDPVGNFSSFGFSTAAFRGEEITIRFDLNIGTDPGVNAGQNEGHLQLRFVHLPDPEAPFPVQESWQTLFLNGDMIGNAGVAGGSNDLSNLEVSGPDANGWVTVAGTVIVNPSAEGARVFFAHHDSPQFTGSFGVGNVSVTASVEDVDIPFGLEIERAVELRFFGHAGEAYRIESSRDSVRWNAEGDAIEGQDEVVRWVVPASESVNRTYRVVVE